MPIAVTCPACQKRFGAPDAVAGKRAKCCACGHVLVVPAATAQLAPQVTAQPASQVTAQPTPKTAQPGPQVVAVKPVAQAVVVRPVPQPVARAVVVKTVTEPGPQIAVGQPVGQPRAKVVVGQPVGQPGRQAVVGQPVGQPTGQPRKQVAVGQPVGQRPSAAVSKPASQPQSQPAAGNSLLDLLEHADDSGLSGPDPFGVPGGAFPPGRATLGRPYARKSIWTGPVMIGLGVVALIAVVGGGITAAVMLAPADDEVASAPRIATSMPHYNTVPAAAPAFGQPAPYAAAPAGSPQMSETERDIREMVSLLRLSVDQMVAIVDRRTAEDNFPKLIENGGKLMGLANKLQRLERSRQLTLREVQVTREVEPEVNQLVARINSEKVRLNALAAQLQMENQFARFNQVGMGPPQPQQQFVPPQRPQFVPPQPPLTDPQSIGSPQHQGPRHRIVPRH